MVQLALEKAPPTALPRRFLLSVPLWGMFAGILLVVDGDALLRTRWLPETLALVHAFTLGVLGNAMFGSVLQFLPAAAGVHVRGSTSLGPWLHVLFNLGLALLMTGLLAGWRLGLLAAGVLLPTTFVLLCAMTLPGTLSAVGQRLLRAGIGVSLVFALSTALLGGCLALGLGGWLEIPLAALVDVHASWGLLGWTVLLIASVARVVMPMFQGTSVVPAAAQAAWLMSLLLALLAGAWLRLLRDDASWLRLALAIHALLFTCSALWLQWRAPRSRRGPLLWSWQAGLGALAITALILLWDTRNELLAGALGLCIALPLLVNGMLLEIVAFLGWIALHRRVSRGVRIPGIQRLLPELDKARVLLAQLPQAFLLPAAVLWPRLWLARSAGLAMLLAWLCLWLTLDGVRRRANRFLLNMEDHP
ncbi:MULTISPECIES: hypothetical protein [unclassified Rhodanobacter]|uniref:hypothetical protein n=1 Tax=unclassified Rhodanobacter TaxID=2621553 RepID=UPI00098671A9|nr:MULTISPECIES: hypothetical protein [unclassified Rhodanobacter]OOG38552.1 hypothetical protein B0E51_13430 [Rhodanobacter sp. C05]OOG50109.1 hypothetical protein B0E50_02950 [Rhodanobacter sp. C01]OOG52295.1 hypothetical protein B0E48_17140 [Rhodanobacter sp. C03]OOG65974.1 hypothetical protein B0E46_00200 [Rhodanobacter sp. B04]